MKLVNLTMWSSAIQHMEKMNGGTRTLHVFLPDIVVHFRAGMNARVFGVRESRQIDSVLLRVDQPPLHATLTIEDGNL